MKKAVLFGGNGYVGSEVTRQWLKRDQDIEFLVVSPSVDLRVDDPRVKSIQANATNFEEVSAKLPAQVDFIVDFVGRPEKDPEQNQKINYAPAETMQKLAEKTGAAMGFIGGVLGPKYFTSTKADIIKKLQASGQNLAYVEPTVMYGAGRKDALAKMVPVFKFLGLFSKNMKPMRVEAVASELIDKLELVYETK